MATRYIRPIELHVLLDINLKAQPLVSFLANFSRSRTPWAMVCLSALGLVLAALFFQHVLGHEPCVKCIYQRVAVIGICFAGLIPLIYPHFVLRSIGIILWGGFSIWGLSVAQEHLEVVFAEGFFIPPCPFFPEFPGFMPLHEWLPLVFGAPGSCDSNDWQFLGMGMPEWMQIIFILYIAGAALALVGHILSISQSLKAAK
ncbi:disulfide bond formation protein DsbB [Ningiella sp. W23]|uniref:disulfide bond formation protein DsbB n=1 Tax=Ningiella sp. W23 TaxID=3023715 RepID=UPI0037578308